MMRKTLEQELTFKRIAFDRKPHLRNLLTAQMVGLLRLVLSLLALAIIYLDPSEQHRLATPIHAALWLYVLYSATLYLSSRSKHPFFSWRRAYCVDVCWYLLFVSLSSGTSFFFFFFFFSIFVASFTDGFAAGFTVTLVSAVLFTAIGYLTAPGGTVFETDRSLLRPIYLLVLGYMIAYWGSREITLNARLTLLGEISDFSNPRFGIDRTLGFMIEKIRDNFNANRSLLLMTDRQTGGCALRSSSGSDPEGGSMAEAVPPAFAEKLLAIPEGQTVIYTRGGWASRWVRLFTGDASEGGRADRAAIEELADFLDAQSFLTIPVRLRSGLAGRFYLLSDRTRAFDNSDAAFITQTLNYIIPIIENIRLVDELASTAAEQERQKIARDLHDSVIQPYIGLRIGLSAVRQKLEAGADVSTDVNRLIELTEAEIGDMRSYMRGLKGEQAQRDNLLPAVHRFTTKFAEAAQIELQVKALGDFRVNDRLAAEIFQMVAEGLSNIRRHTMAKRASLTLEVREDYFCMMIENEGWPGAPTAQFTPRSISERVQSLGGSLDIERDEGGGTTLKIKIPL